MLHRLLPPNATLADRFGFFLYWLLAGMDADWRRRGLRHVHEAQISQRIMGLWKRVRSVLERYRAGRLRAPGGRLQEKSPHPGPPPQERERGRAPVRAVGADWRSVLPRRFGWLRSLLLPESRHCIDGFNCLLLGNEEMQAAMAAAPGPMGRVLRPFCHLLGLEVPAALRLPKRVRGPGLRRRRAAAASRLRDDRGDLIIPNRRLPPREQAEDAVRRSEASGKPIALARFTPAAFGWWAHPPRDGNCPPPEIGYGGRLRPLPKDYRRPKDEE